MLFFIDITFIPLFIESLGNSYLIKIIDISENKLNEERLSNALSQYKSLYENMTPGVVYQSGDGRIILKQIHLLKKY